MTSAQNRGIQLACFIIGLALPLVGIAWWSNSSKGENETPANKALDEMVEESFPASDPPAAW